MTADADIYYAAKLLIDQQGENAAAFAAGRANVLLDEDGSLTWRRIIAAIQELLPNRGRKKKRHPLASKAA
jgi:hypothetical protein